MEPEKTREEQFARIQEIYGEIDDDGKKVMVGLKCLSNIENIISPSNHGYEEKAKSFLGGSQIDKSVWVEIIDFFLDQAKSSLALIEKCTTEEGSGLSQIKPEDGTIIYEGTEDAEEVMKKIKETLKTGIELMETALKN